MIPHVLNVVVMKIAVARQNPLEIVIRQPGHRLHLFRPMNTRSRCERPSKSYGWGPRQMVAGEEKLVSVQKNDVAARVARSGNNQDVLVKLDRMFALNDSLDTKPRGAIVQMHYALAAKSSRRIGS